MRCADIKLLSLWDLVAERNSEVANPRIIMCVKSSRSSGIDDDGRRSGPPGHEARRKEDPVFGHGAEAKPKDPGKQAGPNRRGCDETG